MTADLSSSFPFLKTVIFSSEAGVVIGSLDVGKGTFGEMGEHPVLRGAEG